MKVFIEALELSLNPEELKKAIPQEKLSQIQGKGILQAYTLAHEGISKPKVLGEGNQILKWPRAVIQKLAQVVKQGTKIFIGHKDTNDNTNRQPVGEVVGSFIKELGGKICNVIIGYFPEKEKVIDMDVCSMEADVYTDDENVVGDINEISGVALGSSNSESPAFPGALKLGTVQCFEIQGIEKEIKMPVTFDEIKKAIRDMNIHPWQLYTIEDLKNDRDFGKVFSELDKLKTDFQSIKEEKEKIEKESQSAISEVGKHRIQSKLDERLKDGFTDKQREFIKNRFGNSKDVTEETLDKFLEDSKKEFASYAKLFGVPEEGVKTVKTIEKGEKEEEDPSKSMEEKALETMGVKPNG